MPVQPQTPGQMPRLRTLQLILPWILGILAVIPLQMWLRMFPSTYRPLLRVMPIVPSKRPIARRLTSPVVMACAITSFPA